MALTNEQVQQQLLERFGDKVKAFEEPYGMLTFEADRDQNIAVLQYLYENGFRFLTDLTAVHYPAYAGRELAVVYHVHNLVENFRLRFKVFAPVAQPDVQSATVLYESANWQEREAYDFYGVNFTGHPNLKRIQNVDEMDYFPQRKEFPLEDQTRIDKDDEMFGRGGSFDFGNRREDGAPTLHTLPESEK
ncbi:NADH-quinone oxidoreductase subunit C [Flaviaesturariibacter flavus]|uniref:NADH-quinone oxidoreductase subunit C n=1 Tax=Flaviaesturariibacter flavus TaxID=2502780 RepID=A0A4R1BBL0_9BACT|nr:NADH-quinone oxidoreductase subunit C [Flaviaesturariibacter flavus]TCJ14405.1 NADH-quinone oxidoreductase subunit C [Flaviaesturariibacter flavus]